MPLAPPGRRAVVIAGLRTPFAKAGTVFRDTTAVELARHCTRELLYRTELPGDQVDEVIYGQVVPSPLAPNVAREVSLLPQFPRTIAAYTLNRACASGAQAISNAADQIHAGHAEVILAGGVEVLSDVPILHSRKFAQVLQSASRAKSLGERLGIFAQVRPRDLKPVAPAIAEPSTGESMGQSAEKMAKENGITREAQDEYALMSHQRAAQGTRDGRLTAEIAPWFGGREMDEVTTTDNTIRARTWLGAPAGRRLGRDAVAHGRRLPARAWQDALDLRVLGAVDDEHTLDTRAPVRRLRQQRHVEEHAARRRGEGLTFGLRADQRVQHGLEPLPCGRVGEGQPAHAVAVQRAIGAQDLVAEAVAQRRHGAAAGAGECARDGVGVHHRHAQRGPDRGDGALAAADPPGQPEAPDRRRAHAQPSMPSTDGSPASSTARPPPARNGPKGT